MITFRKKSFFDQYIDDVSIFSAKNGKCSQQMNLQWSLNLQFKPKIVLKEM